MTMEEIKKAAETAQFCLDRDSCENCPNYAPDCTDNRSRALIEAVRLLDETTQKAPAEKPPLGLKPRWLHDKERMLEILAAMARYVEDGKVPPRGWWLELDELMVRFDEEARK